MLVSVVPATLTTGCACVRESVCWWVGGAGSWVVEGVLPSATLLACSLCFACLVPRALFDFVGERVNTLCTKKLDQKRYYREIQRYFSWKNTARIGPLGFFCLHFPNFPSSKSRSHQLQNQSYFHEREHLSLMILRPPGGRIKQTTQIADFLPCEMRVVRARIQ
jgi:hypothetical protein